MKTYARFQKKDVNFLCTRERGKRKKEQSLNLRAAKAEISARTTNDFLSHKPILPRGQEEEKEDEEKKTAHKRKIM